MNGGTVVQEWYGRLAQVVRADPKKSSALAVLTLLMAGLWVRYVCSGLPSSAAGSRAVGPVVATADNSGAPAALKPAQLVQQWARGRIAPPSRNLFAVNLDEFPDDGMAPKAAAPTTGDGFWDELQKSLDMRADEKNRRRQVIENLRGLAAQLHVQSVEMGQTPKALVNGQLVGAGDTLTLPDAQFRVVSIAPEGIVVESQGVRLELLMD